MGFGDTRGVRFREDRARQSETETERGKEGNGLLRVDLLAICELLVSARFCDKLSARGFLCLEAQHQAQLLVWNTSKIGIGIHRATPGIA